MDGNGRWAKKRGLPRFAGHRAGAETVRRILEASLDMGVQVLTLYAFSQENWKRPKKEISVLMQLLNFFLDQEIRNLVERGVRFQALGRTEALPEGIQKKLSSAKEATRTNDKLVFNLALNYGARQEILDAVRSLLVESPSHPGWVDNSEPLTEELFSSRLYTQGLPDPDLLIRTSGEMRLSNFLLWQLSYAELYVTKKFWPDFTSKDFQAAIRIYQQRERRFGDVAAKESHA